MSRIVLLATTLALAAVAGRAGAFALARLGSSMWVTNFAGSDVRRFDP